MDVAPVAVTAEYANRMMFISIDDKGERGNIDSCAAGGDPTPPGVIANAVRGWRQLGMTVAGGKFIASG